MTSDVCIYCHKRYVKTHGLQKLCSPECRKEHHNLQARTAWSKKPKKQRYCHICCEALPNNRVRVTNPALWAVGEGPPDFVPSQWEHSAEQHDSYMDWETTFDNLYSDKDKT